MSEAKFTPGPWTKWRNSVHSEDGICIAECGNSVRTTHLSEEESEANTNLIAAAPELLEALEAIIKGLEASDEEGLIGHTEQIINAKAAIAKARGEA